MTVLSTSKNAADVGSAGVASAVSTSAAAAAASPARVERCCRFGGAAALSRAVTSRSVAPRDAAPATLARVWKDRPHAVRDSTP